MANSAGVERLLFREYETPPSHLGVFRMLYAAWVLALVFPRFMWIPTFPDSFFNPPFGLPSFFTGFPSLPVFYAINVLAVLAATCLLAGYHTRLSSVMVGLLLLLGNVWSYSFGKIDHDIFVVLIPLILQFSSWGDAYSVDALRGRRSSDPDANAWPVALLALVVGLAMLASAWSKASTGWLDPDLHAVRGHILNNFIRNGRAAWVAAVALDFDEPVLWKALDYSTIVLESAFIVTFFRRESFRRVLAVATLFHAGIAVAMEIPYTPSLLAYSAFCDWSFVDKFRPARAIIYAIPRLFDRLTVVKVVVASAAIVACYVLFGSMFRTEPNALAGLLICLAGAVVGSRFLLGEMGRSVRTSETVTSDHPVVLFDGFCGLCNWWVDFVLRKDRGGRYRFAALQSPEGERLLAEAKLPPGFIDSFVLVEGGRSHLRSDGILRVMKTLGVPYNLLYAGIVLPRSVRDWVYDFVAERRLRWFGRRDACRLPTPEERARFL